MGGVISQHSKLSSSGICGKILKRLENSASSNFLLPLRKKRGTWFEKCTNKLFFSCENAHRCGGLTKYSVGANCFIVVMGALSGLQAIILFLTHGNFRSACCILHFLTAYVTNVLIQNQRLSRTSLFCYSVIFISFYHLRLFFRRRASAFGIANHFN